MKKILFIVMLIISLFNISCQNNSSSSIGSIGEIVVDPYGLTPLSAVYTTETVNTAPITVTVKGLYGEPDIIHTYPAGYGTEFEIHGMFPESENIIEVNDGGRIITKNVTVGQLKFNNGNAIPKQLNIEINNLPDEKYTNNPELYFINFSSPAETIAVSRNGYIRYNGKAYTYKIINYNKTIMRYSDANKLYTLLGKDIVKFPTSSHHDTININNDFLYLSSSSYGSQDKLIEINSLGIQNKSLSFGKLIENSLDLNTYKEDEAVFKQIAFGEDLNNIYIENGQQKSIDWCHANSIVYDSYADILYVSSRHRGVMAIDYSEWKLIWWMADETLATQVPNYIPYDIHFKDLKSLEAYRVKGDAINDGPKNQHALFLFANGNLGMFDNQGDKDSNSEGSRYIEYKITGSHGNWTAQKVDEYRDASLYSRITSDVDLTGENYQNMIITYGTARTIIEMNKSTKDILFKLVVPSIVSHIYRSDKMPLYYDEGRVYSEDCNLKNAN
ncbi:aryl-sulfate sulfotransferase [Brachyspira pilosicoli]|uniref:aryl-sulfate sulfotransferase n=1 Tax=Brachyspira pilosicoli TaxID=52584 RepID=UPI0012F48266|nr:aryl-sulfate sulfotransferase [Brachyspira pilosicoli]